MSFFSSKPELGIIFHIGSSSVGAGIVELTKGKLPHVIHTIREHIPYHAHVNPERFFKDMLASLKKVNDRLPRESATHLVLAGFLELKVKHVYYVFSSPWSVTQTKVSTVTKKDSFTVSKNLIADIVSREEKSFEEDTLGKDTLDKLHVLDKQIVQIKLNGYDMLDPYGKQADRVDVSLFMSLIPKTVMEKVFDVSLTTYHPDDTRAYSFPLASFSTIRDVFNQERDFIFLDVGGELSDISIIKDGLILETASFPLGRHYVTRRVAKTFAMSNEEAASLIKLYSNGHTEEAVSNKLQPVLSKVASEWSQALHETLETISHKFSLPTHLFAIINNDFVDFFMRALKEEKVTEFGMSTSPLSITLINHDKLKSAVSFAKGIEKDPFIAMLAAFVGKVYESKKR